MHTIELKSAVKTKKVLLMLNTPSGLINIYESIHSGEVLTRKKIDTLTGVWHPGIIIGEDKNGRIWVAHNHFENKRPTIDSLDVYLDGEEAKWDTRDVNFSTGEIVDRAIAETLKAKRYTFINYNCQTFVNRVTNDEAKSETVDKLTDNAIGGGLLVALLGFAFDDKTLVNTGLTIAGVGAGAKIISKL